MKREQLMKIKKREIFEDVIEDVSNEAHRSLLFRRKQHIRNVDQQFELIYMRSLFTPTEISILQFIESGFTQTEISKLLFVSKSRVKDYVINILLKTGEKNVRSVAKKAGEIGLIHIYSR